MDLDKILQQLPATVAFVIDAHSRFARSSEDRVRRHDGRTPYLDSSLVVYVDVSSRSNTSSRD